MKTAFYAIVVLAALSAVSVAMDVNIWKDCAPAGTDGYGAIKNINVEPCTSEPCKLVRGKNVTMTLTFATKFRASSLKAYVWGIIAGVPAPFPLPNDDGCTSVNCPVSAGQTYVYKEKLLIEKFYPKITVTVKWQLKGDGKEMWCFTIPATVID